MYRRLCRRRLELGTSWMTSELRIAQPDSTGADVGASRLLCGMKNEIVVDIVAVKCTTRDD